MLIAAAIVSGLGLGSMYGFLALGFHVTHAVSRTGASFAVVIAIRAPWKNAGLQPGLGGAKSGTGDSVTPGFHSTQSGPRLVTIQVRSLGRVAGGLNRLRQTSLQVVGYAANFRFSGKLTRRRWSPIISASTSINSIRRGDRRKQ
jgi:hypothetical protein